MKHLVSTIKTQGERKNDFNHTEPGEILTFPTECDGEAIDGGCGCRRSLSGVITHKATTTFKVVENDVDIVAVITKYYNTVMAGIFTDAEIGDCVDDDVDMLSTIAEYFPVGAIVERRGNKFVERNIGGRNV